MPGTSHLVFVYGTLLSGESNHTPWLDGALFVGSDCTAPAFTLYSFGDYPALVHGGRQSVPGEVYWVNDEQLARLDVLEEVPAYYGRERTRLESGCEAWVYTLSEDLLDGATAIISGCWRSR